MSLVHLGDLNSSSDSFKIKVKILKIWDGYKGKGATPLEMVLLYEKGDRIHATVDKDCVGEFKNKLVEDRSVVLDSFKVDPYQSAIRTSRCSFKISFYATTGVSPCSDFPGYVPEKYMLNFQDILTGNLDRRFVHHFSSIVSSITDCIRVTPFVWTQEAEDAFTIIKHKLLTAPVLMLPDFSSPFVLHCDASKLGIGAVLSQNGRPITFFSEKLAGARGRYSTYDVELYAVVQAIKHWRHYLFHQEFVLFTDHDALKLMAGLDCLKFSQFINPTNELQVHSRVVVGVEHEEEVFSLNTFSTGHAKEEGRSHLEDQLDRLLDQPVEFLNSTGQASTRSSWGVNSQTRKLLLPP
ncbi:unnamed protein product [Microthlaspi erraticum]|uniref:Reverse transcriptase/retrotransposon-derived protein RNase H-like domain-containing protein n=1 Tax=Microthlaspi erraticum TaxID=1685480 RepID=A0A6D2IYG0_9BRAS|nr:unnamed protein product [Microthlaspi erraticum]